MTLVLALVTAVLFSCGAWLLMQRRLTRIIVGIGLLGHGANLLIFLMGRLTPGQAPLIPAGATQPIEPFADPLPQALVLTAIVIGFGLKVFALVLVSRLYQSTGTDDLDQLRTTEV